MRISGLIRSGFSLVLLLGLSLACISYYLETRGLPESSLYILKQYSAKHGYELRIDSVEAGAIRGLSLHNFKLTSKKNPNTFIQAAELDITPQRQGLLKAHLIPEKISLRNGSVSIPLKNNGKIKHYIFHFPLIEANVNNGNIEITQMKITGENCNLKIQNSKIALADSNSPHKGRNLEEIQQNAARILDFIASLKTKEVISGQLQFHLPLNNPQNTFAKASLTIPEILHEGMLLANSQLDASFTSNGEVHIDNFNIAVDENEYIRGSLKWHPTRDSLTGSIEMQTFPDRILKIFHPKIIPEISFLNFSKPPLIKFNITRLPIAGIIYGTNSIEDIRIENGLCEFQNCHYRRLPIHFAKSKISLKNNLLLFEEFDVFGHQLQGRINLIINLKTFELFLRGKANGNPAQLSNFPQGKDVRQSFENLWKDFHFDPKAFPTFGGTFHMYFDKKSNNYRNIFHGKMSAANLTYDTLKTSHAQTDIYVDNHFAIVDNLKVSLPDEQFKGRITFTDLQKDTTVNIECQGRLQVPKVLDLFSEEWRSHLSFVKFTSTPKLNIKAVIPIQNAQRSTVHADVQLPAAELFGLPVNQARTNIHFVDKNLAITIAADDFNRGLLTARFQQHMDSSSQTLTLNITDSDLNSLLARKDSAKFKTADGTINGGANLLITDNNGDIQINGNGRIDITDGNFWQVPILSPLLTKIYKVLPFTANGAITDAHAELNFKGNKILADNIVTNGNIIALSADGYYNWQKDNFDFKVKTHYLKNIVKLPKPFDFDILSGVFTPVTSILEGRVSGSQDNWQWELQNFKNIKKFFGDMTDTLLKPFKSVID